MSDKKSISKEIDVMFANSPNTKVALERLASSVPKLLIKSLISSYLKFVTILIDGIFKQIGIIIEDPESFEKNLKDAKHRIRIISYILNEVLKDPVVKAQLNELALNLNNSVLRPFLLAAIATMEELTPTIDEGVEKLEEKVHQGIRKLIDAGGNAVLSGLGTVPYVGNILNATATIANTAMGIQAAADTAIDSILEATLRVLMIMQKVQAPGMDAVDSFIDFALNAKNTVDSVKNKVDKLNANVNNVSFEPDALMNKKDMVLELNNKAIEAGTKPSIDNAKDNINNPKEIRNIQNIETPPNKTNNNPEQLKQKTVEQAPKPKVSKKTNKKGGRSKKKHHKKKTNQRTFKKY